MDVKFVHSLDPSLALSRQVAVISPLWIVFLLQVSDTNPVPRRPFQYVPFYDPGSQLAFPAHVTPAPGLLPSRMNVSLSSIRLISSAALQRVSKRNWLRCCRASASVKLLPPRPQQHLVFAMPQPAREIHTTYRLHGIVAFRLGHRFDNPS